MILALGLVFLLTSIGTAAKIPDLIGTWTGPESWLDWDGSIYQYHGPEEGSLVVTNQTGAMFYGTIFDQPLVGNISTNKEITATAAAWGGVMILNGKLTGKKIKGTFNYSFGTTWVEVGSFEFTKQ